MTAKNTLKWPLFALPFVPLLVSSDVLFPFIFPKVLFVRAAMTLFWILLAVFVFLRREEVFSLFRERISHFKNPVYIFVGIFLFIMFVSTIFAVNPLRGFFGDVERGEGLLGILYFYSFFFASLLVFKKEDWVQFFKLNLITGAVLFFDALGEVAGGEFARAQSTTGNPTFLAAYFLFVILAAFLVLFLSQKRFWKYAGFVMVFLGAAGVFLTGTRGAIVGLFFGAFLAVVYLAAKKGPKVALGRDSISLQKVAVALLVLGALFVGAFAGTREHAFWQTIPGVSRFADISLDDSTFQTRLISAGVSLRAVNPSENSIGRTLIGYGPDNFSVAYNKYYNPEYMRYEALWFDRAHNKIFDVLVMHGALGLLVYLGIWGAVVYVIFRKIRERQVAAPLLFFAGAFFVQNLFVFDQVSTYIPFLALFAFTVFAGEPPPDEGSPEPVWFAKVKKILPFKLPVLAAFFAVSLILYSIAPFFQSRRFIDVLVNSQNYTGEMVLQKIDEFSEPYNYAQGEIRGRLMRWALPAVGTPGTAPIVDKTIALYTEYVMRHSTDPRDWTLLGSVYRTKGLQGEAGAFPKAEEYYERALEFSPTRQEHFLNLATVAIDQEKFGEAQAYLDALLAGSPDVPRTQIYYGSTITRMGPERYAEAVRILNTALSAPYPNLYLQETEINVLRGQYGLFLSHAIEERNAKLYEGSLEGMRDLEVVFETLKATQFDANVISELPPIQSTGIEEQILRFREIGWDMVRG